MEFHRDFKGVWIPKEIWLNNELTLLQKCLYAEINSLNGEKGCYASNEYLAEFFNLKNKKSISKHIAILKKKELIYEEKFNGRERILRTFEFTQSTPKKVCRSNSKEELLSRENNKENSKEKIKDFQKENLKFLL